MLGITMQLDISAKLTPQVTTIICHDIIRKVENYNFSHTKDCRLLTSGSQRWKKNEGKEEYTSQQG